MHSVTHFRGVDDVFNDLFRGFLVRPLVREAAGPAGYIPLDVEEANGAYVVTADLPGIRKEDLKVTVDGNRVAIRAETRQEQEARQDGKVLHRERYFGKVYRSFSLAEELDESRAEAQYTDGVLRLVLPKKAAHARTIAVQ